MKQNGTDTVSLTVLASMDANQLLTTCIFKNTKISEKQQQQTQATIHAN